MKSSPYDSSGLVMRRDQEYANICRLSDAEVFNAFPNMTSIINPLLSELCIMRDAIVAAIGHQTTTLAALKLDPMSHWFWLKWLDVTAGADVRNLEGHIRRLRRQLALANGLPTPDGILSEETIQIARDFPVADLLHSSFRRRGKSLVGLCPFHEERTPSFHIFLTQNRGWCYGCNQGGDAITMAMMLNQCSFPAAVRFLVGGRA